MTKYYLSILSLILFGCGKLHKEEGIYPFPTTALGFITYDDFGHTQMYFVPLKDKNKRTLGLNDFKSRYLGVGFAFTPSDRVKNELSLLQAFKLNGKIYDKKLHEYNGNIFCIPVRIVYEIDPNALNVFANSSLVDTIYYGKEKYNNNSEKIGFIVNFPGADVLKVSPVQNQNKK